MNFKGKFWRTWALFLACGVCGALGVQFFGPDPVRAAPTEVSVSTAPASPAPRDLSSEIRNLRDRDSGGTAAQRFTSFAGLLALIGICFLFSNNRSRVDWRLVAWGVGLQIFFAVLVLNTAPGMWVFARLNDLMMALLGFTRHGTDFLFGSFLTGKTEPGLVNLAFQVLPTIIFFSSLMAVGYQLGVMQRIVKLFAFIMHRTMRCSGAETLSTAANIFVGQTEAPLVVKPYLDKMTQSELMAVMVGGFANTAGGVLAAYVGMLSPYFPDIAGHLIAQSVMSAPATLVCAKILFPETEETVSGDHLEIQPEKIDANVLDAAARGASEGLSLALNVFAMLLAFIALIAMVNAGLRHLGLWAGFSGLTIENILGVPGAAFAFLMGVPWADCWTVGKLLGVKTAVNEFVAYLQLADLLKSGALTSYRSVVIASYALSSFANFASIAIQVGGIAAMAPARRHDLARLGLKAMFAGALATFMTATIAGILVR